MYVSRSNGFGVCQGTKTGAIILQIHVQRDKVIPTYSPPPPPTLIFMSNNAELSHANNMYRAPQGFKWFSQLKIQNGSQPNL